MSLMQIGFLGLVFVATFALAFWLVRFAGGNASAQRMRRVLGENSTFESSAERFVDKVAKATKPIAKLSMPEEGFEGSALKRRFVTAGLRNASAPTAFFGAKTVLAIGLPMLAYIVLAVLMQPPIKGNALLFWLLLAAGFGYYLPNVILSRMIFLRQREIFENFPDALDLMTVCMEAGLGTEAALNKVAEEMVHKSEVLSDEMRLVNLELRAGAPRDRALRNLALRTGVEEVDGFVSMIIQAERFGTSIGQALRVHSDMLRTRRRQRAEEAAAKIALKLLFPLIFGIFPTLLLVLLGPAFIQIYSVLLPTMAGTN